ncbi:MAG: DUF262 domain-containing protein [bacterium]
MSEDYEPQHEAQLQEEQVEDNLGEDSEENVPFKYSITSYGADYTVDGLVKRMQQGSVYIPPFQRAFVWNLKQASRFVESFLLGLPVPGIFLSKELDTGKLLVIDGQQRLRTLQYFYEGLFADSRRQFALKGVQPEFEDVTYKSLREEDRLNLDNSILHATIVQQDEPSEDQSSIYHIFERLNTGGTLLQPQEIRACIYHGEFNALLKRLNENRHWRSIYGKVSPRMRDQELVLRFFALLNTEVENYSPPMKQFLNTYMAENRDIEADHGDQLAQIFADTIELAYESMGSKAFKPERTLNAAVFDAVMVGIAMRLKQGNDLGREDLKTKYDALLQSEDFVSACKTGTATWENVKIRISMAVKVMAGVQ